MNPTPVIPPTSSSQVLDSYAWHCCLGHVSNKVVKSFLESHIPYFNLKSWLPFSVNQEKFLKVNISVNTSLNLFLVTTHSTSWLLSWWVLWTQTLSEIYFCWQQGTTINLIFHIHHESLGRSSGNYHGITQEDPSHDWKNPGVISIRQLKGIYLPRALDFFQVFWNSAHLIFSIYTQAEWEGQMSE